jgi:hypothetical protein
MGSKKRKTTKKPNTVKPTEGVDHHLLEPWERTDEETEEAYEAFCLYLEMGRERTLYKVAQKLKKHKTQVGRWSAKYDWVLRVTAWDREQAKIFFNGLQEVAQKQAKRMCSIVDTSFGIIESQIQKWAKKLEEANEPMEIVDLMRLMRETGRMTLISAGKPEKEIEDSGGLDDKQDVAGSISLDLMLKVAQKTESAAGDAAGKIEDAEVIEVKTDKNGKK